MTGDTRPLTADERQRIEDAGGTTIDDFATYRGAWAFRFVNCFGYILWKYTF